MAVGLQTTAQCDWPGCGETHRVVSLRPAGDPEGWTRGFILDGSPLRVYANPKTHLICPRHPVPESVARGRRRPQAEPESEEPIWGSGPVTMEPPEPTPAEWIGELSKVLLAEREKGRQAGVAQGRQRVVQVIAALTGLPPVLEVQMDALADYDFSEWVAKRAVDAHRG